MSHICRKLVLFARYPVVGKTKTRLIPALGTEGAAALHRRLVLRALRTAQEACRATPAELEVHFEGGTEHAMSHWLGDDLRFVPQGSGDLGERMAGAFEESFRTGSTATVIIGSDCPDLRPDVIIAAFARLKETPAVLGPALDGGYYLVGLSHPMPELFRGIPWVRIRCWRTRWPGCNARAASPRCWNRWPTLIGRKTFPSGAKYLRPKTIASIESP